MAARKTPRVQIKKPVAKKVGKNTKKSPAKKSGAKRPGAKTAPVETAPVKKVTKKAGTARSAARSSKKSLAKKNIAPKAASKPKRSQVAAMAAMSELVQKRSIKKALSVAEDGKTVVDAYMRDLDHPFKAELEAVRQIILAASAKLAERIKWNAPSFYYKGDLGAFNPRSTEYAHLILLFPGGAGMEDDTGLLEGNHKDRREAKFHNMADVKAKKPALEALVQRWVELRDR